MYVLFSVSVVFDSKGNTRRGDTVKEGGWGGGGGLMWVQIKSGNIFLGFAFLSSEHACHEYT